MDFIFKIIEKDKIYAVIPLIEKLNDYRISVDVLEARFKEMLNQNYECAGIFEDDVLIGICGLWFCTRHYSGKSVEVDHVYIDENYRGKGLGKWIHRHGFSMMKAQGGKLYHGGTVTENLAMIKLFQVHPPNFVF